jgi:hypothetical protein
VVLESDGGCHGSLGGGPLANRERASGLSAAMVPAKAGSQGGDLTQN